MFNSKLPMTLNNHKKEYIKYILFASISFLFFACNTSNKKTAPKTPFIPNDASIIIKCDNFKQLQSHLNNSSLLQSNKKHVLSNYFKNISALSILTPQKQDFFLCFSPLGKSELGVTLVTSLNNISQSAEVIEKNTQGNFTYNNQTYNEVSWNNKTFYTTKLDSNWVATDNKLLIENSIRQFQNKSAPSNGLAESLNVLDNDKSFSILLKNNAVKDISNRFLPKLELNENIHWSGWTSGDYAVNANTITFDGVYKPQDSIFDYTAIFSKTNAQQNKLAQITPTKAKSFSSYTFDNFEQLSRNLDLYNGRELNFNTDIIDDFIAESDEFGTIELSNYSLDVFSLLSDELDISNYLTTAGTTETYRDIPIYKLESPVDFNEKLIPLISSKKHNYYIQFEEFIVFSENINGLKELILAVKNEDTFTDNEWYDDFASEIAGESNVLHVTNVDGFINKIASFVSDEYSEDWKKTNTKNHKLAAIQITNDINFSHIHQVITKTKASKIEGKVSQTASVFLNSTLLNEPQLVKNYLTKGMDVVVQDKSNQLSLLSSAGNILWQKQYKEPILGKIQQMDMYRNGRLQLVFTTASALHVLDRKGKEVAPFPLEFNKPITQPVAIFDYDKNRKYRIAVTQADNMSLYDNRGKKVNGFKFKNKTNANITAPPKHIRIGSKDYILVNESNNGLHILNRTGKERVKIKGKTLKTNNEWYWYKNAFTTLTADNLITQINTKGAINKIKPIKSGENIRMDATKKTMVTIVENTLTIKGKKVNLDYGVYTAPKIFYINNKIFVSITDTQTSKVYLYDSNAKPISGFPVYGNSIADINNMDKDSSLELVVKGDNNNVLFYEFR